MAGDAADQDDAAVPVDAQFDEDVPPSVEQAVRDRGAGEEPAPVTTSLGCPPTVIGYSASAASPRNARSTDAWLRASFASPE